MVEGETSKIGEKSTKTISKDTSGGRRDLSNRHSTPVIGGQKIDAEKFDGKINFSMWRREVMNALIQIDLDVVLKNKRHLCDEEIWDRMNEKACGQIRSCLTKEVKYLVKDEECAVTLWRTLEKNRNIARDECAFCHEKYHWRKDCPKAQKRDGKKPAAANMARKDEDSDYSLIITPTAYVTSSIVMRNDQPCRTMGIRTIRLKMFDGMVRKLKEFTHRAMVILQGVRRHNLYYLKGGITDEANIVEAYSDTTKLWHVQLGHVGEKSLQTLMRHGLLKGTKTCKLNFCEHCVVGKKTRVKFGTTNHDIREILEYVHSDVWGPTKTASISRSHYFVTFVDDFSRRVWVYTMRAKDEVLEIFVKWKKLVETQTRRKIKVLRSDNGGEYTSNPFLQVYQNEGIKRYFTVRHTPQQNGVVERMNRTLLEKVRYYDSLRIFGCPTYYHVKDGKLDPRARKVIFVGFKGGVKGFKIWDLEDKKFVCSRDVTFDEASMMKASSSQQVENKTKKVLHRVEFDATPYVPVSSTSKNGSTMEVTPRVEEDVVSSDVPQNKETIDDVDNDDFIATRRPRREIKKLGWLTKDMVVAYALPVIDDDIPNTFGSPNQSTPRYKARFVAKGFAQKEGIDYNEIFSPVVKHTSIYIILALVAEYELELAQLDVKTAFLHGDLEEEIYMIQPCGFKVAGKENHVCKLIKTLYGLKQSPRQWYKRFDQFIQEHKFTKSEHDYCVYFRRLPDGAFIYLLLYVDDILIALKNRDEIERLKKQLASEFEMKDLGDAQRILGMEIHRDKKNQSVWLTQKSYLKRVLERFDMDDKTKLVCTPLAPHFKLRSSSCPKSQEEGDYMARVLYASVVGSLMYAMVCTRPDISQAVSMVSRYMHNPGKNQWLEVKWILRYLYGTVDVGLLFKKDCGQQCVGYCDSDFAGDLDKRRSTTGYVFTLGGDPVNSILQSTIALSTTKAEYMAATEAVKEAVERLVRYVGSHNDAAALDLFEDHLGMKYYAKRESELINEVVNHILKRLDEVFRPRDNKNQLVGVESTVEEIESLLGVESKGVYALGIWGIGGIGKTTIARAIFDKISGDFDGSCFLENVREESQIPGGLSCLRQKLLSNLLKDKNVMPYIDLNFRRLGHMKVLIVFDDVTCFSQLESLMGSLDWLTPVSRIILTTRNKQVLRNWRVSKIYEMEALEYHHALELFS
ncbi:Integrase catalytic domain-containing protein [Citrus sinensis]|nr:Integrase catalytic domain-containing protein [Citrus sinensis]